VQRLTTVFLIRHGESQANAGLPTVGPQNVALTLQGHEQAKCITDFLRSYPSLDLIVTSPYLRTKQTAEPTISMSLFRSVLQKEWKVQEFTYLSSMHQQQSTTKERRPLVDAYWERCQPLFVNGPGSESFAQFIDRVQAFMMRLQNTTYDTIAVFSHEQFINAVLWLIDHGSVKKPAHEMQEFRHFLNRNPLPNGSIVQVNVPHNQTLWTYERITEHLKQPGVDLIFKLEPNIKPVCERELEPLGERS
jgi:probable phosphoglycerate mutase